MTHSRLILPSLFALLACFGAAHAEGDANVGKQKSESCAGCHGEDGNAAAPIFPKLAGQHAAYLGRQLADFKSHKRVDPAMNAMAASLSEADIADIAAWYRIQKIKPEQTEKNELGEKIFRTGLADKSIPACAGCHGPSGSGNREAGIPALSSQYAAYLGKTLNDYKSGERGNDANAIMRTIAQRLSEKEIDAVSEFAAGLH
ncbi:cytochrome c [Methylococcus sp. EFPC2]|uniref:c-type cytochrome n=1 Tax=Methylococcus sp. EFPC2 TaxID=2812648 RepID=UPI001967EA78|nr:c-type cytochrome [Methylococcus sp. EFPC2]QSA96664.1 cytochrome c4 [Methylococcus sp. EFPC2]